MKTICIKPRLDIKDPRSSKGNLTSEESQALVNHFDGEFFNRFLNDVME